MLLKSTSELVYTVTIACHWLLLYDYYYAGEWWLSCGILLSYVPFLIRETLNFVQHVQSLKNVPYNIIILLVF